MKSDFLKHKIRDRLTTTLSMLKNYSEFTFYSYTIFFLKKDRTTPATTLWISP